MATYLDGILEVHRARAAADHRSVEELTALVATVDAPRGFGAALCASDEIAVIAEIKRRSPSKGDLAVDLDPNLLARQYAAGGAACLSVLTDAPHFGGSSDDLAAARAAVSLPVLRKDFTVSWRDLYDARAMGADAALLIVAALDNDELDELVVVGATIGIDLLVEVHDEKELGRALAAGAEIIGVNQRDLHTFVVDTERALRVGADIPHDVTRVAESGVRDGVDVARLAAAGFDAVLVGEALVTADDPAAEVRALRGELRTADA